MNVFTRSDLMWLKYVKVVLYIKKNIKLQVRLKFSY